MKKFTSVVLACLLCLSAIASASALTVDLSGATLDELLQLQQEVASRISELRAAEASAADRVELSGSGTAILSDIVIPFSPSRVILEADGDVSANLTGGAYDHTFTAEDYSVTFFGEQGTFALLVEAQGTWSFIVEPIMPGGSLPLSGSGPYVSDYFELSGPMIITVSGAPGTMTSMLSNFVVTLRQQSKYSTSWGGDTLTNELFSKTSEVFSEDLIIKPVEGRTLYCFSVKCDPGVEWSINPK